ETRPIGGAAIRRSPNRSIPDSVQHRAGPRLPQFLTPAHACRESAAAPSRREGTRIVSIGSLPLSRFTILDLTHARAGPTAVRQLADWGANVIKIEPPMDDGRDVTGSRREGL